MSTWSSGYNTDLGYTFGFYREVSPAWLDYVALNQSVMPPSGAWRYLELGCGQGYGLMLLAALYPDHEFLGIDFNPVHIAHARQLAQAARLTNVQYEEADFLETAAAWPAAWGKFEYVVAHGIYSWMSRPVCGAIVETIKQATHPGALAFISYNAMPAWISSTPIQHLMRLWQTTENLESVTAVETGIQRLQALTAAQTGMTKLLPGLKTMLDKVAAHDRAYLVQEYLHDNWHPRWFDQVVEELKPAKLTYVGTATLGDLFLTSLMPTAFQEILAEYHDPVVREVMVDIMVNQSFRRDVFSRGAVPLWSVQRRHRLLQQAFALVHRPDNSDDIQFKTSLGELKGKPEIYCSFYDKLATGPQTTADLMQLKTAQPLTIGDVLQALTLMLSAGQIAFYRPPSDRQPALRLNRAIAIAATQGAPYRFLIASKIGTVLSVSDVDLMLLATLMEQPDADPRRLGAALTTQLLQLGKGLTQNGQPLTRQETMQPYALELATKFLTKTFPSWKHLGLWE